MSHTLSNHSLKALQIKDSFIFIYLLADCPIQLNIFFICHQKNMTMTLDHNQLTMTVSHDLDHNQLTMTKPLKESSKL